MRNIDEMTRRTSRKQKPSTSSPPSWVPYMEVGVTIKTWPSNECTLFNYAAAKHKMKKNHITVEKTNELREEVVTRGIIHFADTSALYTIRFVHPRTIEEARKLRPGQYITVLQGRFHPRHKRDGMEFIVKEFSSL